jgi:hypothetical protein|nr:hypothetical protein [Kofleriaceae bacterium]
MAYRSDSDARDTYDAARERDRRQLPMLDRLEVASPCKMRWDDMMRTGDDRVRSCGACQKNVYNVSALTADEVDRLILATESRACVRYWQRADGTILLADCTIGGRRRAAVRFAVAGVVGAAAAAAMAYTLAQPVQAPPVRTDLDGDYRAWPDPTPHDDATVEQRLAPADQPFGPDPADTWTEIVGG